jgi:beta-lactamase superfamily II metal-dependent hydrolase
MKFEIEMLNVGNADSFVIRYFGNDDKEVVILIDAGKTTHANQVVEHIQKYTTSGKIDLAICTHPDNDHIGGFEKILDKIDVAEFWMHDPRAYRNTVKKMLVLEKADGSPTRLLLENLNQSINLMDRIDQMELLLHKVPFAGLTYNKAPIKILAPSEAYYIERLKRFDDIHQLFENRQVLLFEDYNFLYEQKRGIDSSKPNNSSVITLFYPHEEKYLFTADADKSGLEDARLNYDLSNLEWLQVPHHGSINNINSELLAYFDPKIIYISASGKENKPHTKVIEMIKNYTSAKIFTTAFHGNMLLRCGTEARENYNHVEPF